MQSIGPVLTYPGQVMKTVLVRHYSLDMLNVKFPELDTLAEENAKSLRTRGAPQRFKHAPWGCRLSTCRATAAGSSTASAANCWLVCLYAPAVLS